MLLGRGGLEARDCAELWRCLLGCVELQGRVFLLLDDVALVLVKIVGAKVWRRGPENRGKG